MQPESERHAARRQIDERMGDIEFVGEALARGVRDALLQHKRAGNPVVESRDGELRWIPPEEIPDVPAA